jgi:DNA-binding LacI/PurR family transcriptional regulator
MTEERDGAPIARLRPATMADIAAELGISRQLVSLALRGLPGASEETRLRVQETAQRLAYNPHTGARSLRQATNRHVGVVFTPAHATEPDIVESLYPAAEADGYQILLSPVTGSRTAQHAVRELLGFRCAGLVVIGSDAGPDQLIDIAQRFAVPIVAVGSGPANPHYDVVRSAGEIGVADCVRHLAGLGHTSLCYVDTPAMPPAADRLRGFVDTIDALGLPEDVLVVTEGYTEEAGAIAAQRLLRRAELPTAVVMSNDQAALGLVLALARASVRVPADVSVTGYDDSRVARIPSLDLTSSRQDARTMGEQAIVALLRRLRSVAAAPQEWVIPTELVIRSSTASPRVAA